MKTQTYFNIKKIVEQDRFELNHDLLTALHIFNTMDLDQTNLYDFDKKRIKELLNKYQ
jgi:hypothetical protein